MDGKVVVITGANAGLGLESAKVLASRGFSYYGYYILSYERFLLNRVSNHLFQARSQALAREITVL